MDAFFCSMSKRSSFSAFAATAVARPSNSFRNCAPSLPGKAVPFVKPRARSEPIMTSSEPLQRHVLLSDVLIYILPFDGTTPFALGMPKESLSAQSE